MDIFFTDPNEVPLPPEEVRIIELRAEPWSDGRRVGIYLEVDPFQKRPNAEIKITDNQGQELAHVSIIESIERKMEMTMHLRGEIGNQICKVSATIYYATIDEEPEPDTPIEPIQRTIVDHATTSFELPKGD